MPAALDRRDFGAARLDLVVQCVEVVGHEVERRAPAVGAGIGVEYEHQVRSAAHLELRDAVVRARLVHLPQTEVEVERRRSDHVVRCEHHVADPERRSVLFVLNWQVPLHAVQCDT